jgi:integrase
MATKLTKGYVDRVKPGAKDEFHWDAEPRGFALRVTPTGKMTFIVQGRVGGSGKEARITIGSFGVFTVEQAREEAREHLRNMRKGIDPRELKKQDTALRVSLDDVCTAYVDRPGKLKAASREAIKRHVATTFAAWKEKPIASITEEMCRKRYREMLTGGLHGKKGAPGQANQAFAVLGALINYAGRQHKRADGSPIIVHNPVDGLKDDRVRLKPRTARIPDAKVGAVWNALDEWRAETVNPRTLASIDLITWLLLTGCRLSEGNALRWEQVNLDEGHWHLPDPKNSHEVFLPLSSQAVALLKRRREDAEGEFVFPSSSRAGHIMDPRDVMLKVSAVAGVNLCNHDLRRTFTNVSLRCCRIEKFRTDLLTNHLTRDVTAEHYFDTTNLQWLQPEVQQIADWIEQQAAVAAAKNVVQMHGAQAA